MNIAIAHTWEAEVTIGHIVPPDITRAVAPATIVKTPKNKIYGSCFASFFSVDWFHT